MKTRNNPFVRSSLILSAITALFSAPAAFAGVIAWGDAATPTNYATATYQWDTATNWAAGLGPVPSGTTNVAQLKGNTSQTITLTLATPFTIGAIARAGSQTNFILNGSAITMDGTGQTTVAGTNAPGSFVSGEAAILSNQNNSTFVNLTVNNNIIMLNTNLGIGGRSGTNSGNSVTIGGNITNGDTVTRQLNIRGALASGVTNTQINGSIGATLGAGGGGITINNVTSGNAAVNLAGAIGDATGTGAAITISNTATNAGNFNISGAIGQSVSSITQNSTTSTTTLSGNNANFAGTITVTNGALSFLKTTAKSGTATVANGATLGLGVGGATNPFPSGDVDSLFANTLGSVSMGTASNVGIDTTNGNFTYASNVASTSEGLNKLGANTLTLSGINSYSGNTIISNGTLKIASTGSITHSASNLVLSTSTARLDISSGGSVSFKNMTSVNSSKANIAGNWTGNAAQASAHNTLAGTYTQTAGTGTMLGMVTGNAAGDVTSFYLGGNSALNAGKGQFASLLIGGRGTGTFAVSGSGAIAITGDANPAADVRYQLVVGNVSTFNAPTAGTSKLIQQGGTVVANGLQLGGGTGTATNGIYYLNGGSLTTSTLTRGSNAASTGTLSFGGGTFKNGAVFSTDANVATTINSGGATIDTTAGNLVWSGAITAGNTGTVTSISGLVGGSGYTPGQLALTFSPPTSGTTATGYAVVDQSGVVTDIVITDPGSGYAAAPTISGFTGGTGASATAGITTTAGGLTKTGSGTLTLSGPNSYAGPTSIDNGSLIVNGDQSSASGLVTMASSASLKGTGKLGGGAIISGTLAPGSSIGTLTANGSVTFAPGATYALEVGDWTNTTAGTGYDTLAANALDVTATSASKLTIHIDATGISNFTETAKSFVIASAASAPSGVAPDNWTVTTTNFTGTGTWALAPDGTNLTLTYTPPVTDPFAAWIGGPPYNISGPTAAFDSDYDNDGIKNGLEWILGGNPTLSDNPSILPVTTGSAASGLTLVFNRATASLPPASTLVVDFDGDLDATWAQSVTIGATNSGPDANGVSVAVDTPSAGKVTVTIPASNAIGGKLFTRLRAVKP